MMPTSQMWNTEPQIQLTWYKQSKAESQIRNLGWLVGCPSKPILFQVTKDNYAQSSFSLSSQNVKNWLTGISWLTYYSYFSVKHVLFLISCNTPDVQGPCAFQNSAVSLQKTELRFNLANIESKFQVRRRQYFPWRRNHRWGGEIQNLNIQFFLERCFPVQDMLL